MMSPADVNLDGDTLPEADRFGSMDAFLTSLSVQIVSPKQPRRGSYIAEMAHRPQKLALSGDTPDVQLLGNFFKSRGDGFSPQNCYNCGLNYNLNGGLFLRMPKIL
jgi:hypothetical protein